MKGKNTMFEAAAAGKLEIARNNREVDTTVLPDVLPNGAVLADLGQLSHVNTYGELPKYYLDIAFTCKDCGVEEIWKAESQKWWYEEAKGHTDSTAVRCRPCRQKRKANGGGKK